MSRYILDPILGGRRYGTSEAIDRIKNLQRQGNLITNQMVLTDGHRLDTLAGILLGDAKLWWVLAALSGIGWGLQVPAGTRIIYPASRSGIADYV